MQGKVGPVSRRSQPSWAALNNFLTISSHPSLPFCMEMSEAAVNSPPLLPRSRNGMAGKVQQGKGLDVEKLPIRHET